MIQKNMLGPHNYWMEAKEKNVALIYLKVFFVPLTVYITSIGKMHLAKIDISLFMVLF